MFPFLTQPLFSFLLDAGPPLPQSSEIIQTCQPKPVYPASLFLKLFLNFTFIFPKGISILFIYLFFSFVLIYLFSRHFHSIHYSHHIQGCKCWP